MGIGPATEADGLSGGGRVESLLCGPPRSGKRARIGVRAGRRNIECACCGRRAATCCVEELPHGRRTGRRAGKRGDAQAFQHEPQHALVLILQSGLIAELGERRTDERADHAASAVGVVTARFIEHYDQQAVLLESGVFDQRIDVALEPVVGGAEATIVGSIATVRADERVVGQVAGRQIGGEMRERYQVLLLRGAVMYVSEISNGNMADIVLSPAAGGIAAQVAHRGQALGISFPGFSRSHQFAHHVVRGDGQAGGGFTVIVGEGLAGGEHEVVADGRMRIGVIPRGQSILTHQAG